MKKNHSLSIKSELLNNLFNGVIEYDEEKIISNSNKVIEAGFDINNAISDGLARGMRKVGELYEEEEYGIPEVLLCAEALEKGMKILKPHLKKQISGKDHVVCIGTVEGDIHSIGKNMVKLMFEVGGFKVIDLGEDVMPDTFIEIIKKERIDVVALSTMMTPTLKNMKSTINTIREKYPEMKIIVGGASVTKKTARSFNTNGYAQSAQEALKVLEKIV